MSCDDGNRCTNDSCDPVLGCARANNSLACNDGSVCTIIDHCSGGSCIPGTPLNCDDSNPCTTDSCDAALGCVHVNNSNACDDGNVCTTGDACSGRGRVGGAALNCDDGNVCTTDSCNAVSGCAHVNNTNACDNDWRACTTSDACPGGSCVGTVTGATNHLVISQIQVAGTTTDDEFVELYNPALSPVSLVGLSLQYKGNMGASWVAQSLGLSGVSSVPARGWVLIARSTYDGAVPADETFGFSMFDPGAQVVLVSNTDADFDFLPHGGHDHRQGELGIGELPGDESRGRAQHQQLHPSEAWKRLRKRHRHELEPGGLRHADAIDSQKPLEPAPALVEIDVDGAVVMVTSRPGGRPFPGHSLERRSFRRFRRRRIPRGARMALHELLVPAVRVRAAERI